MELLNWLIEHVDEPGWASLIIIILAILALSVLLEGNQ